MIGRWIALGLGLMIALMANKAWADQIIATRPVPGPAQAIGSPANGCLAGGQALPLSGPGWETLRPERNRFWGHPDLVNFIQDMAGRTASLGTLLIADMAQPRGGHMAYGHGSHQNGLDVDILYRLGVQPLSEDERARPLMDEVIDGQAFIAGRWDERQTALVKIFAEDSRVERIFVNAAIKRQLCKAARSQNEWLRKLRPWWGHADHFHVRLKCPAGDPHCVTGPALPPGLGCGSELDWWFSSEAKAGKGPPGPPQTISPACQAIFAQ